MTQLEQSTETELDPYTMFVYALRSPHIKETYFRRLRRFFDFIDLNVGTNFSVRCNLFVDNAMRDPNWAFTNILRFLQFYKERIDRKETSRINREIASNENYRPRDGLKASMVNAQYNILNLLRKGPRSAEYSELI